MNKIIGMFNHTKKFAAFSNIAEGTHAGCVSLKAAEDINESLAENRCPTELTLPVLPVRRASTLDIPAMRDKLKEIMSEKCYVIRNESDMNCALEEVREMKASLEACFDDSRDYFEMLNLCITAESILVSAMARKESVGAHNRVD